MTRLRDTYRVLTLDEAVTLAGSGFVVNQPTALVTFDDGYRDNAEVAAPILSALGVPASFFLPTSFLQEPRLPWWDFVAYAVNRATVPVLRLDRPEPMEIDLERTPRTESIARVVRSCLDHHVEVNDEAGFRAHLKDRAGVEVDDSALGRALFMTWDQARALASVPGMSVGSHAHSHRALALLSESEQRDELAGAGPSSKPSWAGRSIRWPTPTAGQAHSMHGPSDWPANRVTSWRSPGSRELTRPARPTPWPSAA